MAPSVLKQRRLERDLTQVAVAKAIGVSQPTYQNYEAGTLNIPEAKLKRLTRVLGLSQEEILGEPRRVSESPRSGDQLIDMYWGEVTIHFRRGPALVLSISYEEYKRLFRELQRESKFFHVSALSNQLVAVRRAAVSDVYLADEASDTFGPEQDTYDTESVGLWSDITHYWQIVEDLVSEVTPRDEIEAQYSEDLVTQVARQIGLDMPEDIDRLIKEGKVAASERESVLAKADSTLERMRGLVGDVTWRLSNGKVRRSPADECDFMEFWWVDDGDPQDHGPAIIVGDASEAQTAFINPDALDYISIPEHRYRAVMAEELENAKAIAKDAAKTAKKRSRHRS